VQADPSLELTIDVQRLTLEAPAIGFDTPFALDPSTQHRLLNGLDDIGISLGHVESIDAFEAARPAWMPSAS